MSYSRFVEDNYLFGRRPFSFLVSTFFLPRTLGYSADGIGCVRREGYLYLIRPDNLFMYFWHFGG